MGHVFKILVLVLVMPVVLIAQPVVEWVWEDSDTLYSEWGFRLATTSDNGVVLSAQNGNYLARLSEDGSLIWSSREIPANGIAELGDSTFLAVNPDSIFRIDQFGNVLNTVEDFSREYDLVGRIGDITAVSYAFESQVWEGDEWEFRGYSGTLIYDNQATRLLHQHTAWCDWGSCHLNVSDYCSPEGALVYQVDQEDVNGSSTTVRLLHGGTYVSDSFWHLNDCLEPRDPHLAANDSGQLFEVVRMIAFCDTPTNVPRVEVLAVASNCEPGSSEILLDSSYLVGDIVGFEGLDDGGFILAVNRHTPSYRLSVFRLSRSFQIIWEYSDFIDVRIVGEDLIVGDRNLVTVTGTAYLEGGSRKACALRFRADLLPPADVTITPEQEGVRLRWNRGWNEGEIEYQVWRGNDFDNIATIVATTTDTTYLDTETPGSYARQFYHVTARRTE